MDVAAEVEYIVALLGRELRATPVSGGTRVEQQCPVCEIPIAVTFRPLDVLSPDSLFREIFALYDEHRCVVANHDIDTLRMRAERESERLAERAGAIRARESDEPPRGLPSLYERAERESVLLAERALGFAR